MVCAEPRTIALPFQASPLSVVLPPEMANSASSGFANRVSIGSEPREATLARLRARLLRMIVENEEVRHAMRIRPR